jgi:hypothetical protein
MVLAPVSYTAVLGISNQTELYANIQLRMDSYDLY